MNDTLSDLLLSGNRGNLGINNFNELSGTCSTNFSFCGGVSGGGEIVTVRLCSNRNLGEGYEMININSASTELSSLLAGCVEQGDWS